MTRAHSTNAILATWEATLAVQKDAVAIFGTAGETLRTFAGIEAEAETLAGSLEHYFAGEVIAVQIGNDATWPALLLALFRCGLIPLPIGRHLEGGELESVLATTHAAALLTPDGLKHRGGDPIAWDGRPPEFLKLTSGTTSTPRAVCFRAEQLVADCDHICSTMGITPTDVNFGVIPFSHSYGFSNLLTPLLCRGVPVVAADDRIPRAIVQGLAQSGATVFPGIPLFFQKILGLPDLPPLPRLRLCLSAGAPLAPEIAVLFHARFGLKIHAFYGASECGGIGYDATEEVQQLEGHVGTPMHGVAVSPEEDGRVAVRSAAVGDGYFPAPEPAALSDGCYRPGDLIAWSGDAMRIVGRVSDMINVAGRKLNPADVEHRILTCPGVRQAAIFGVPSALRGEEAVACVAGDALEAAAVLRFCRENLSGWQVPRDIWIVPEIVANERGKISRRALAAEYLGTRARS